MEVYGSYTCQVVVSCNEVATRRVTRHRQPVKFNRTSSNARYFGGAFAEFLAR